MSEMVERVARVIYYGSAGDKGREGAFEADKGAGVDGCRDMARAAIEAMREPTEAMCDAYWRRESAEGAMDGLPAKMAWQAMIDEALK